MSKVEIQTNCHSTGGGLHILDWQKRNPYVLCGRGAARGGEMPKMDRDPPSKLSAKEDSMVGECTDG